MKKKNSHPIDPEAVFDLLAIGPKNRNFSNKRADGVRRRAEKADWIRTEAKVKASRTTPDYIETIRMKRLRLRLTQQELARRLRTNQAVISKLERGEGRNTITFLKKVCDELSLRLVITTSDTL